MKAVLRQLFILCTVAFAMIDQANALNKQCIASGDWDNPAIWAPAGVPLPGDDVYIYAPNTVSVTGTIYARNIANYGGTINIVGNTTFNHTGLFLNSTDGTTFGIVNLFAPDGIEVHVFNGDAQNQGIWNANGGIMRCNNSTEITITNLGVMNLNVPGNSVNNIRLWNFNGGVTYSPAGNSITLEKLVTQNTGKFQSRPGSNIIVSDTISHDGILEALGGFTINGFVDGYGTFTGNNFVIGSSGTLSATTQYQYPRCFSFPHNLTINGTLKNFVYGDIVCDNYGRITVADTMFLSGTLQLPYLYIPAGNALITFIKSNKLIGTFSNITPALPPGWNIVYNFPANGDVSLQYASCTNPTASIVPANSVSCAGAPVTLTAITDAPNPSFLWNTGQTTQSITVNPAFTTQYYVSVFNASCSTTVATTVAVSPPINLTITKTNPACAGQNTGTATANVSGGTAPYTYLWSNGATSPGISALAPGNYTVTVTDQAGCTASANATIMAPTAITLAATSTNVSCAGGNNGSASVTASGGTPGYTYLWSNGATTSAINTLSAGTYTVTVTDANNCTQTASVTITAPPTITLTTAATNVSCAGGNNGSATVTASGGTPGYTYLWSNGATTSAINNLSAGNYTVAVKDANNCTQTASVTVTAPPAVTLTTAATNVSCAGGNNGSATVTASGGTPGYTYLWSNGATTSAINNLAAGNYTVTAKDANNCTQTAGVTITAPTAIILTTTSTNVSCAGANNGSATVTASGGTPGYTYFWSNGATTATINNLTAGTYDVIVRDANNCAQEASVTIAPGIAVSVNLGADKTLCFGQTALIDGSIGVANSVYQFTSTSGFTSAAASIEVGQAGSYFLQVTTPQGCIARDTIRITVLTDPISADFLIASQGFKDSLVTAFNIAIPAPDSVQWIIPANPSISTVSLSAQKAELKFVQEGIYFIGMRAFRGQCVAVVSKQIVVVTPGNFGTPPRRDPLIKQFTIAPNPSRGQFTAKVLLREETPVRLRLINFANNNLINDRSLSGSKEYTESYNLSVVPGVYIMLLETPKESRIEKIVIQ